MDEYTNTDRLLDLITIYQSNADDVARMIGKSPKTVYAWLNESGYEISDINLELLSLKMEKVYGNQFERIENSLKNTKLILRAIDAVLVDNILISKKNQSSALSRAYRDVFDVDKALQAQMRAAMRFYNGELLDDYDRYEEHHHLGRAA